VSSLDGVVGIITAFIFDLIVTTTLKIEMYDNAVNDVWKIPQYYFSWCLVHLPDSCRSSFVNSDAECFVTCNVFQMLE
jgi:hypothetical protein